MRALEKGSRWRREVHLWLLERGFDVTRRDHYLPGDDLQASIPGLELSVEAKNHRELAIGAFVDQANRQAHAGQIPVVFAHRRNRASVDDCYVIMSGRAFGDLIK
jgi:hypothetical protein